MKKKMSIYTDQETESSDDGFATLRRKWAEYSEDSGSS